MTQYLITFRSLTHAQRSSRVLERAGITTAVIKAPQGLSSSGCAYAITLRREPEMALGLIAMLSTELTEEKEKVMLLSIRDPDTRLAGFLLDRDGKCLNGKISMKLSDIAATISLRPETVSRSLTKLQKAGYIERAGRGELRVTDREGLYTFFHRKDGGSL